MTDKDIVFVFFDWPSYYEDFFFFLRLDRKWLLGVKTFLSSTLSVIKTTLFPTDEDDSVTERKGSIKKKRRKSKYMRRKNAERSTEIRQPSESVFKHNWAMFGGLFFLEQKYVYIKLWICMFAIVILICHLVLS